MAMIGITGCGQDVFLSAVKSALTFSPAKVWLQKISIRASDDMNDSSPVKIHVVIPYKEDLYKDLLKMNADTYFKRVDQLKHDNVDQLDIFSWDVIRNQRLNDLPITPTKCSGEGVIIFARYSSSGDHRKTVGTDQEIMIYLNRRDFLVSPLQ
jgi:type VI secretion system protein